MLSPKEHYRKTFYIHNADSELERASCYHIRYLVYCEEFKYERPPRYLGQQESDEYNALSGHCLLVHKSSHRPVGCARLVHMDPEHPQQVLPFWKHCAHAIDVRKFNPLNFKPGQLAEFSRIAIIEEFRRREKNEGLYPSPMIKDERRFSNFPVIPVCLFLATLAMLLNSEAIYGVAMMELKLVRLLRRFGIRFDSIGSAVEYHGLRGPYVIHRDDVRRFFDHDVDELFLEIYNSLNN